MGYEAISNLANVFLALSDKTRLRLIDLMRDGEVSVGFLADSLNESQPKTSRHLAYLRNSGLVCTRRDGKWIYYGLEKPADPATENILAATLISLRISSGSADGLFIHQTGGGVSNETSDILAEAYMYDEEDQEFPVYLL